MKFTETHLKDCFILEPHVINDERGYFYESFHEKNFVEQTGLEIRFVQDNESKSNYGVIRGLHMQRGKFAQAKLVRVLSGRILDVAVDARKDSPTYGQNFTIELSSDNKKQLYIPKGFLHGFSVLSEQAVVAYKCDAYYDRDSEDGVFPMDETLKIDWGIEKENQILSEKDSLAQKFTEFNPF